MASPPPHLPPPPVPMLNGSGRHTPALRSPPAPRDERPQALAALLSAAYADIDALRHELRGAVRRADHAERALAALQPSPGGSPTSAEKRKRALADEQARADAAERERDELRDRLRQVCDAWDDHARFAASCESRFADARAGFARTLHDAAGTSSTTLPPLPQTIRSNYPTLPSLSRPLVNGNSPSFAARHLPPPQAPLSAHVHANFAHITLPTPPQAHRRVRDPSPSGPYTNGHPAKRARAEYDDGPATLTWGAPVAPQDSPRGRPAVPGQPHAARAPREHARRRSTSRASSSSSMSLDKMLLEATGEDRAAQAADALLPLGGPGHPLPPPAPAPPMYGFGASPPMLPPMAGPPPHLSALLDRPRLADERPLSRARLERPDGGSPLPFPRVGPAPVHSPPAAFHPAPPFHPTPTLAPVPVAMPVHVPPPAAGAAIGPGVGHGPILASPAPLHAPVHAAAPPSFSKRSKPEAAPRSPAPAPPGARACRQCGQPGRYKDGKCVEKWGPGPDGPGTVCDRCRKKMKRVERRGAPASRGASPERSTSSSVSPAPAARGPPRPAIAALGADGRRADVGGGPHEDEMDAELLEAVDAADARREWADEDE